MPSFPNSDPPRIGIVSWDFGPSSKGGLGRSTHALALSLRSQGLSVEVASATRKRGGHLFFSLLLPLWLNRWMRAKRITLLIIPVGPGGVLLTRHPRNCHVVAIAHHTYAQQAKVVPGQRWKRIFLPLERRTLALVDTIICYSPDTRIALTDVYGIPPDRIRLLPQIIALDRWTPLTTPEKEPGLCVCVARLEARKGVTTLLRAWPSVLRGFPAARLMIVGDGIQSRKIDRMIRHVDGSVERRSSMTHGDLIALVQRAELALCPSLLEGFGLAAAEAMAAGTPVIASDVPGLRSLIDHGKTGWLVSAATSDALAAAIVHLLCNPQLRQMLSERAQASVHQRFEHASAGRALQDCLDSIYSQHVL